MFIGRLFPSISLLTRRTEMGVDEKKTNKDKNERKKRKAGKAYGYDTYFFLLIQE